MASTRITYIDLICEKQEIYCNLHNLIQIHPKAHREIFFCRLNKFFGGKWCEQLKIYERRIRRKKFWLYNERVRRAFDLSSSNAQMILNGKLLWHERFAKIFNETWSWNEILKNFAISFFKPLSWRKIFFDLPFCVLGKFISPASNF